MTFATPSATAQAAWLHAVAALTLAPRYRANTAIFTVINALLLRPLPGEESTGIGASRYQACLLASELRLFVSRLPQLGMEDALSPACLLPRESTKEIA